MRLAAVDIGTNTVRYLVADVEAGAVREVTRGRDITRLGQGVDDERRLHPEAIERTIAAVSRSVEAAREAGADHVRVAGTSALRDANDRATFASLVAERTGERLEVLSGHDEGRLSLLGATLGLPAGKTYVVCDVGGGSTELSTANTSISLDIGSVRLKERYLLGDPPTTEQVAAARASIEQALDVTTALMVSGYETFVGVAGTVTSLAALHLGLPDYDRDAVHGTRIKRRDVMRWTKQLLEMSASDVAALGPVEPGRADVLPAGVLILKRIMLRFLFEEVFVSEHDILEGLVLDAARNR